MVTFWDLFIFTVEKSDCFFFTFQKRVVFIPMALFTDDVKKIKSSGDKNGDFNNKSGLAHITLVS